MKHYRDLSRREKKQTRLFMLAVFLMGVGCLISLGSALHIFTGFRVAINAANYAPKVFWAESVIVDNRRRGGPSYVKGKIDGTTELLGLTELPESQSSRYVIRHLPGQRWPNVEEFPIKDRLSVPVWYDSEAYQYWSNGRNSRIFSSGYPMDKAWSVASQRLILGNLPLVIGLLALWRWAPRPDPLRVTQKKKFSRVDTSSGGDSKQEKPAAAKKRRFRER